MAHIDYANRGVGIICPNADIINSITESATTFTITNYSSVDALLPPLGSAVMVDDEIMQVVDISINSITVLRGCADSIPQPHAANATMWFFDNGGVGVDTREYMATETIGVKLLMQTSGDMQDRSVAPALELTFDSRFARPYPPAAASVNGDLFYEAPVIQFTYLSHDDAVFTWNHRNRVTQADVLVDYLASSITGEAGQSYLLKFYKDGTYTGQIDVGSGATYTLTYDDVLTAVDIETGDYAHDCTAVLFTVRDGFESRHGATFKMKVAPDDAVAGWGNMWGAAWGN